MPFAAAAPLVGGALGLGGGIASGTSGKKAQKAANKLAQQQLGLQQNQFGLAKQQLGLGNQALGGATNYFSSLLRGGQAARDATGPYASLIGQQAQGTQRAIQAGTPRGGEQNLALAQNRIDQGNNIARLYAGMQPLAAQGLGQLGGEYLSSAGAFNPGANTGGAFGAYGNNQNLAAQGAQGFGSMLFDSVNKLRNRGGSGGFGGLGNYGGNSGE